MELVVVIVILVTLMTAGVSMLNGSGPESRRAGTDMLTGLIEQARTVAITSRSHVVLAIAEPGDLPAGDERCRLGLFRVNNWPSGSSVPSTVDGVLLNRWQMLNTGVAMIGGEVDGIPNPVDSPQLTITYGSRTVQVHAVVFPPRGGLQFPAGSTPVALRVAEGNYRGGRATPYLRGASKAVTEDHLKIGRVTARPYRTDG